MKIRHKSREAALQFLYRLDEPAETNRLRELSPAQLAQELNKHFNHFEVVESVREYAAELASGVLMKLPELDPKLEAKTQGWKLSRLAAVDRSILRIGAYEVLFSQSVPAAVSIDEAVELAKQFGSSETASFVNGILDAISKERA